MAIPQTYSTSKPAQELTEPNVTRRSAPVLFGRGLLFGIGTALGCAVIRTFLHIFFLDLIFGLVIGLALIRGSKARGGVKYQIAASVLTFASFVLSRAAVIYLKLAGDQDIPLSLRNIAALLWASVQSLVWRFNGRESMAAIEFIALVLSLVVAWRTTSLTWIANHPPKIT